jgi:hypothetical protein
MQYPAFKLETSAMARITKKTREIDKGWDKIQRELKKLDKAFTKVGIQSDAGKSDDGKTDLVLIAATNEFGTDKAGKNKNVRIPERSFVRAAMDNNKKKINSFIAELIGKVEDGKITAIRAVGLLGEMGEGLIKRRMTTLRTPPNAQSTIDAKGSSNPLIDKGNLRNAVRHEDHV